MVVIMGEGITLSVKSQVVSSKKIWEGNIKKVVIKKYYDLDGQLIDEGTDTIKYEKEVSAKIVSRKIKYIWTHGSKPTFLEDWEVTIDNEKIGSDLEFTQYEKTPTQLILYGCVGCG